MMAMAMQSLLPPDDVPENAYSVFRPTLQPLTHPDLLKNVYSVSCPTPLPYDNHIDILTLILLVIFLVSMVLYIAKLINQCIQNCGGGG
jgi:hypothetical protein